MLTVPFLTLALVSPVADDSFRAPADSYRAADGSYQLEWKLREGDLFYAKTTATMDQSIVVMGMQMDQTITMKTVVRFRVKSVKPGATVVEMTYLQNAVEAAGLPGGDLGDKIKNVTLTATLDDKMRVTKLDGYDKLLEAVAGGDDTQKALVKAMMPESAIRQNLGQTFVVGPGKPVAVGDTWKQTDTLPLGPLGVVEMKQSLRLDDVKDQMATITVKSDLSFKPGDGDGGLPFKITKSDLKADRFAGTHRFDLRSGRIAESKIELEMSGSITIGIAGQSIEARIAQKMKTTSTITNKNPIVD